MLRTDANVLEDVVHGKSLKESTLKRVPEGVTNYASEEHALAPKVLKAGAKILEDVSQGRTWTESAIKRIPEGFRSEQSGSGKRKRRVSRKRRSCDSRKQRKDIFNGVHTRG